MKELKYWKNQLKKKRESTDFREFLMEIASWSGMAFYRNSGLISRYPESDRINVSSIEEFEEIRDDFVKNGLEYNFQKNAFENYATLLKTIKFSTLIQFGKNENSNFSDVAVNAKNAYLSHVITLGSENAYYSMLVRINSVNIFNSFFIVDNSEVIYFSKSVHSSYKIFYSKYIKNCSDIWLSSNLTGCKECISCDNLENTSYCIENIKYSKEEYFERKKKILSKKLDFLDTYKNLDNKGKNHNSFNVSGENIIESENVSNGSFVFNLKNGNNTLFVGSTSGAENWFDFLFGGEGNNNIYGVNNSGGGCQNIFNSVQIGWSSEIYYSQNIETSSHLLFCNGLKNKSYCILNKQYKKEDWEILTDKIFSEMEKEGSLGEFFPGSINPFYFNDTIAGMLGNFTKQEVEAQGYMWRDKEIKVDIPVSSDIISTQDLDIYEGYAENGEWRINPKILKKVIKDKNGNYYRIVQMEYDFLVKYGLPLPRLHWLDRMKTNFGTHK